MSTDATATQPPACTPAGEWHTLSSDCTGEAAHGEPGRLYTFRLTAADNVGNSASAEAQAARQAR